MEVFAGHGFISQAVQEVGAGQSFCGLAFSGSLLNGFDSCESYLTSNLLGYLKEFAIYSHPCFVLVGTHTCFTTRDMTDMSR